MDDAKSTPSQSGMLEIIFQKQKGLNDAVLGANDMRDAEGRPLTMHAIERAAIENRSGVNDLPNQWLTRFADAMEV